MADEGLPLAKIKDLSADALKRLSVYMVLMSNEPQIFNIRVGMAEALNTVDMPSWEGTVKKLKAELSSQFREDDIEYQIELSKRKFMELAKEIMKEIPLTAVGII